MGNIMRCTGTKMFACVLVILLLPGTLAGCENSTTNGDTASNSGTGNTGANDSKGDSGNNDNSSSNGSGSSDSVEDTTRDIAERVDFSNMAAASAEDVEYKESVVYSSPVNGTAETCIYITDYTGNSEIVVVPDTINDHPVISVHLSGEPGSPRENVKAIKIPDGAYMVEMEYCNNLTTVELPDEIASSNFILKFLHCTDLTYINVPNGVNRVGQGMFVFDVSYCENLISLELPESVTGITGSAFANCTYLESINLPDGVTEIPQQAFMGCSSLKDINIPASCWKIDRLAFKYSGLESITIPANVQTIGQDAFSNTKLKTVVIEDSDVELILVSGCFFCTDLTYIELPDRVTKIDDHAFFVNPDVAENASLVIKCSAGSIAEAHAKANGFTCQTN